MLFVNFDENDGFFDHVPPPAAPSYLRLGRRPGRARAGRRLDRRHRRRVPRVAVPPTCREERAACCTARTASGRACRCTWSRPGARAAGSTRRCSITPRSSASSSGASACTSRTSRAWRRAVCGDLTSAFNFADPDDSAFSEDLPDTAELAERARALPGTHHAAHARAAGAAGAGARRPPVARAAVRAARRTPSERAAPARSRCTFANSGRGRRRASTSTTASTSTALPRRYTVEAGKQLARRLGTGRRRRRLRPVGARPERLSPPLHRGRAAAGVPEMRVVYVARSGGLSVHAAQPRAQAPGLRGAGPTPTCTSRPAWRLQPVVDEELDLAARAQRPLVRLHGARRRAARLLPPLRRPGRDRARLVQRSGDGRPGRAASRSSRAGVVASGNRRLAKTSREPASRRAGAPPATAGARGGGPARIDRAGRARSCANASPARSSWRPGR